MARTTLYGLVEPSDLATTSWTPSISNTARMAPPAMMPVPAGAERTTTLPDAVTAFAVMVQRAGVAQRHADEVARGRFRRLADRFRHFARLAVAEADAAAQIADDDEGREAEALAALHDLRDAIDVNELVGELALDLFTIAIASAALFLGSTCHGQIPFIRTSGRLRARPRRAP